MDKTWSEADMGARNASDIDDLIEDTRYATRERANVEHYAYADESGQLNVWRHRKESGRSNYGLAANKPATVATGMIDGALYYETDTGLLKKYNATSAAWTTIGSPDHSGVTTTYTTGTIDVTNASQTVTGTTTEWTTYVAAGDVLMGPDAELYNVAAVVANNQLTLDRAYAGTTAAGQSYTIYLNGHPQYLSAGGGAVDGDLSVAGEATLAGGADMSDSKVSGLAAADTNGDAVRYEQVIGKALQIKTGTYTGDGTDDRGITGVGFQPVFVVIYQHSDDPVVLKADCDTTYAKRTGAGYVKNYIQSLDADGFTVGSANDVNQNGQTYTYVAFGLLA